MPVTIPDWVPGVGGTSVGPPDQPQAPPAAPDDSKRKAYIEALAAQHGGLAGEPAARGSVLKSGPDAGKFQPTGFDLYTFNDGTSVEVNPAGEVQNLTLKKTPTVAEPKMYGSSETGYYVLDPAAPNGVRLTIPPNVPNADEEINKALTREQNEQLRRQRQTNEQRGFGYATDDEVIKRSNEAQQLGINQRELTLRYQAQDEAKRQFDVKQKAQDLLDAQSILQSKAQTGLLGAQTGRVGAETTQLQQQIEQAGQKFPLELGQLEATRAGTEASTAYTQAQTEAARQKLATEGAPQVQAAPAATQLYSYQRNPLTGEVTRTMSPEFQPKTQADIAARVGQIQAAAQAKQQELLGRVGQNGYTADAATRDFNTWWDQNVAPQQGQLEAAQQEAQFARTQLEQTARQQAYQTAQGAGTQAINAFQAMQRGRVGPGFAQASAAAGRGDFAGLEPAGASATGYQAPDITQTAPQQVMEALKFISPTAAAATGAPMPNYAAINIPQALNRTTYMPGGGAPVAAPPPPLPGGPGAADWFSQWQARQAADVAQQRQALPIPTPSAWQPGMPIYGNAGMAFAPYSFGG
jgi:hypothetical protein